MKPSTKTKKLERNGYLDILKSIPVSSRKSISEKLSDTIKRKIETGKIQIGTELGVKELSEELFVSPVTVSKALKQLSETGLLEERRNRPYIVRSKVNPVKNPGYDAIIQDWAKQNDIQIQVILVSATELHSGSAAELYTYWNRLERDFDSSLFVLKRLLKFRSASEDIFRAGLLVNNYLKPEMAPELLSFYKEPENQKVGLPEYLDSLGINRIRSEWTISVESLNPNLHLSAWHLAEDLAPEKLLSFLDSLKPEDIQKPFLKLESSMFASPEGIFAYTEAFFEPKIFKFKTQSFDFEYIEYLQI